MTVWSSKSRVIVPGVDLYAAYRTVPTRFLLDANRGDLITVSSTITAALDALGSGKSLNGSGFTRDTTHLVDGQSSILYSSANGTQRLTTTTDGPASGASHAIHWVGTLLSGAPADVGTLALVGRNDGTGASILGAQAASGGTVKLWWGSFQIGEEVGTTVGIAVPAALPSILDLTWDSATGVARLYIDGVDYSGFNPHANSWLQGYGLCSGSTSFPPPDARLHRASWHDGALTKQQLATIAHADVLAMPSLYTPSVFRAEGDSITFGYNLLAGQDWPSVAAGLINAGRYESIVKQNAGVSGSFAASNTAMANAIAAYQPRAKSTVVVISWGSNDFTGGASAATVIGYTQLMIAAILSVGAIPVIGTVLERGAAGAYPAIAQYAAWALSSGYHVIDFRSLPHAADPTNTTYFQSAARDGVGGTHPEAPLAADMGALAASVVGPLLV